MISLPEFEDYIAETIIRDVEQKCEDGESISKKIRDGWVQSKTRKGPPGEHYRIWDWINEFVMAPEIIDILKPDIFHRNPPENKAYLSNVNASILRIKNEYDEYYNLINRIYDHTFKSREHKKFPLKWMLEDKQIRENMGRKKNRHFYTIFNRIIQERTSFGGSKLLAEQINIGKHIKGNMKYQYILYSPAPKYIDLKLRGRDGRPLISSSKIYHYLQECVRHGIFIDKFNGKIRKNPKTRTKIYAVGYYHSNHLGKHHKNQHENVIARIYFLTKKRHQHSLRIFDTSHYNKTVPSGQK